VALHKQLQLSKQTVETISEINQQLERELEHKDQDLHFCKQYIEELNAMVKEERNLFSNGTKSYTSVGTSPSRATTEHVRRKSFDSLQERRKSLQKLVTDADDVNSYSTPVTSSSSQRLNLNNSIGLRPPSPIERSFADHNEKFPTTPNIRPTKENSRSAPREKTNDKMRDRLISDFQQ
jgi:hypothetical protein